VNLRALCLPHQRLFARYALRIRLDPRSWGGARALVETAYRVILRRPARAEELGVWVAQLEHGQLTGMGLIWQLLCSSECEGLCPGRAL
jgi:hypothetical protein